MNPYFLFNKALIYYVSTNTIGFFNADIGYNTKFGDSSSMMQVQNNK